MRSWLRYMALACIVASLFPQAAVTADALHVLLDHGMEHDHAVTVDSIMPVLHGHAHSAETPDHDHPLTVPTSGSAASHARGPLQAALPVDFDGARTSCGPIGASATRERSANRRPAQAIPTVLRI